MFFIYLFIISEQLSILEAWDEATSENPSGLHDNDSLYKVGRAATVTLANDLGLEDDLDKMTLERLGQLAVCAGFDLVQQHAGNGTSLELAVAEDGWSPLDEEQEERKTMFWEGVDAMSELDRFFVCLFVCCWFFCCCCFFGSGFGFCMDTCVMA